MSANEVVSSFPKWPKILSLEVDITTSGSQSPSLQDFKQKNCNVWHVPRESCLACNKYTPIEERVKTTSAKGTCAKTGEWDASRFSDPPAPRFGTFPAGRKLLRLAYFDLSHLGPREEANKRLFKSLLLLRFPIEPFPNIPPFFVPKNRTPTSVPERQCEMLVHSWELFLTQDDLKVAKFEGESRRLGENRQ